MPTTKKTESPPQLRDSEHAAQLMRASLVMFAWFAERYGELRLAEFRAERIANEKANPDA